MKLRCDYAMRQVLTFTQAPMRMEWIAEQVKHLPAKEADSIFTNEVLRPETDTYLTPNWDEMVPFPMTWKIRYDGFGESDYRSAHHKHPYGCLASASYPDNYPPWYQPQGASHFGGTFLDVSCICAAAKVAEVAEVASGDAGAAAEAHHESHCPCVAQAKTAAVPPPLQLSTGCGLSDSRVN